MSADKFNNSYNLAKGDFILWKNSLHTRDRVRPTFKVKFVLSNL